MIVDVQCVMPSLPDLCRCYHTRLITTSAKGRMTGALHRPFSEENALPSARAIVQEAIMNFPNRRRVDIPREKMDLIAGFSHEAILSMLGGSFRGSYLPLNSNIINGRIRGVAGVVGCCNPKVVHDQGHVELVRELIANDVLVIQTGCSAIACAKAGLMTPESAAEYAGKGLAEVCRTVGMPPVLHAGSCVDNSRILVALSEMVRAGGLGKDIADLPVAGAAPEWMSEKAIAIGQYFVASGVYTLFGVTWPTTGSEILTDYLFKGIEEELGGKWDFEADPELMAKKMIAHIDLKRKALGIDKARERVLFDMDMRREMAAAAAEQ